MCLPIAMGALRLNSMSVQIPWFSTKDSSIDNKKLMRVMSIAVHNCSSLIGIQSVSGVSIYLAYSNLSFKIPTKAHCLLSFFSDVSTLFSRRLVNKWYASQCHQTYLNPKGYSDSRFRC